MTGAGHAFSLNHIYNSIPANSCWLLNCESNSAFNYTQTHNNWQLITTSGLQSKVLGVVVCKCFSLYTWANIKTNKNHSFLRYTGFLNTCTEQKSVSLFLSKILHVQIKSIHKINLLSCEIYWHYIWANIKTNKNLSFLVYTGFLNVSTEQNQYPYFCLKYCMLKSKACIKLIYVFLWNILAL